MAGESGPVDRPERCHHCQKPMDSPIGCLSCHTIYPSSSELTHFDRLGLSTQFSLALPDLERRYLAWSRELHPDFYQTRTAEEQAMSLKLSAALNDAYSTLKDPVRRAEYLLFLFEGPTAAEHRSMPEGFLEEILELRMEIDEAKEEGLLDSPSVQGLRDRITRERDEVMGTIGEMFRQIETSAEPPATATLATIREQLNTVKYRDGLLRELSSCGV